MPCVPPREYRESWLGTTAGGPERAAGVGAQPRPPDANPPNGVGGVGSDPAGVCPDRIRADLEVHLTECWAVLPRCRLR